MTPRSLSLRLTVWYILSAFALVVVASGVLYAVLASELAREDMRLARDQLASIRLILQSTQWPNAAAVPMRGTEGSDRELYVRLLAPDGQVVLETAGIDRIVGPAPHLDSKQLNEDGVASRVRERDGDTYQLLTAPVTAGRPNGMIQIAMNHGDEDRLLALYRMRLMTMLTVILCVTAALGYWLARSSMRPIEHIGRVAERVGSTNLDERIVVDSLPDEVRRVALAFNTMLDRLEESFARVGQFSDDVAHELRTPVSNLRGQIEVGLSKGRTREEYEQLLGSCLEECERISRIIASLLFLARVGGRGALALATANIGAEVGAVRDFYEASAAEAGLKIDIEVPPNLEWPMDRVLFQQALANLVSNAIAHSEASGAIQITVEARSAELMITVSDEGCGIADSDRSRVFDRFYRADRARTGAGHSGLGLSMVKAIVERHGGSVELHSQLGKGTRVVMRFTAVNDDPVI